MLRIDGQFVVNNNEAFGDKSITHRALILGSIAKDKLTIVNAAINDDTMSTMRCLSALGAHFEVNAHTITVTPIAQLPNTQVTLHCGNSGTTARLLAGLVCGLNIDAVFVGDSSLSTRPMDRVVAPLRQMGADIRTQQGVLMEVRKTRGTLYGINYVQQVPSAQVKSAIMLAALFAQGQTTIVENIATRNHTELMMQYLDCKVEVCHNTTTVCPSRPCGGTIYVPQDLSTAAFLSIVALKTKVNISNVGLNATRTGFLQVLKRSGMDVQTSAVANVCGELRGNISLSCRGKLQPLTTNRQQSAACIDELPLLATLACFVDGTSVFCGVDELRHKESDRVAAIIELCTALGRQCTYLEGNLQVTGSSNLPVGCVYINSYHDHRIAMCGVVASVMCGSVIVDDDQCIAVSTPNFLQILSAKYYKCALLGDDIATSKSPLLMCMLAQSANVNMSYNLLPQSSDTPDSQLINIVKQYDGVNVTMPFKQRMAVALGAKCPSVNTIGKGIEPCTTDGYGLIKALEDNCIDVCDKNILVVGAGGTAVVAVQQLLNKGARVNIINRTISKAKQLELQFGIDYKLSHFDGVVSCIPVCEYERQILLSDEVQFVFSVNYKQRSILLDRAQAMGIQTVDGLPMLYWQAVASFELWTGVVAGDCLKSFVQKVKQ